ncbi:MAG: tetratricopeptide repeat protein, partial [Candidatus Brocadiae bacterium]|nr:tetratricopeptide repeat protein [Candidatus Brocadiia bacterium]
LARHGRLAEAISGFERALEIAPDSAKNHFNLGIALAARGELDRASEHFHQALRIQPDHEAAQSALARALHEQAQHSGAPSAQSPLGGDALPAP